jgi:hypothetical protein
MQNYMSTNVLERNSDIRLYLFRMHNNIRQNQDKPIMFTNVKSLKSAYESVNTRKAFRQFTYAAACVCELDPSKWTAFETFFTTACETMGLKIPVYDPGHPQNWLYFVYTHCKDQDMTYEEVMMDFLPIDYHERFKAPPPLVHSSSGLTTGCLLVMILLLVYIVFRSFRNERPVGESESNFK